MNPIPEVKVEEELTASVEAEGAQTEEAEVLLEEELLFEDVSIDGMCGVY